MNFLAHAYLSFKHPGILVGNMISDFVKGKSKYDYPVSIQQGIMLHRDIDAFTDNHPATQKAKTFFKPAYRLYSGAITDIIYDHFLAIDASVFPAGTLKDFSLEVYGQLEEQTIQLPNNFLQLFTFMKMENWLLNYGRKEGIEKSLRGLIRRAKYLSESDTAYKLFLQHYSELGEIYKEFFPDVKSYTKARLEHLHL